MILANLLNCKAWFFVLFVPALLTIFGYRLGAYDMLSPIQRSKWKFWFDRISNRTYLPLLS